MTLYAALRNAVLCVRDAADGDPAATEHLRDHDVECVAATDEQAFCGTFANGLHRSIDGETWERIGATVLPESITAVTISPHDSTEVWVGTEPSRLFRSPDAGKTWRELPDLTELPSADEWYFPPRPDTHHVRWIEVDPTDPDRIYVGIEAGALLVSEDGGETWTDRPQGARRDNHQLTTHPDAEGRVYAAAGDGYAESRDGGRTWSHPQKGLEHRYVWSVAVDPGDPETVLASAASGANAAHRRGESYVYRRQARDAGWDRIGDESGIDEEDGIDERAIGDGLPTGEGVFRYVLAPGTEPGEFYAVSNTGLFRSADAGSTWERLDVEWPDRFAETTAQGLAVTGDR